MRYISFGTAVLVGLLVSATCSYCLTIDGQLSIDRIGSEAVLLPFRVSLSTNLELWKICVTYTNRQTVCGSDGEKTCIIRKWSSRALSEAGVPEGMPQASIVDGVYPGVSDIETRMVWFAFASSSFFLKQTNPLPCLWRGGNGQNLPSDYGVEIRSITFLGADERLPRKVSFTFSTNQMLQVTNFPLLSYEEQNSVRFQQSLMQNIENEGRLMAGYDVAGATNYNGATLPLEFNFGIIAHGAASAWITFHGRVTNIFDETPASFLPAITEKLQTVDYRFSDKKTLIDNLRYTIDSEQWPPTNDSNLSTASGKR